MIKQQLPIPCLSWVPFWLLGIALAKPLSIPLFLIFISISISIILFIIPKTKFLAIPIIALIAGFLMYTSQQNLSFNHINNLFKEPDQAEIKTSYTSINNTFTASSFQKDTNRRNHIQQFAKAKVISNRENTQSGYRYILQLISFSDIPVKGKIILFCNEILYYGDIIECTLRITENIVSNPGQIDFSSLQQQTAIYATANLESPVKVLENKANPIYKHILIIRKSMQNKFSNNLNYSAPMASSLILGDRQNLSEYAENFYTDVLQLSGLMHFFAVSGFHVGVIALFLFILFRLFKIPVFISQICTIMILILYAILCNASPPILRAVLFFSFLVFANMFSRMPNKWHIFLLSSFFITLFNPSLLFSVSMQLSYLAFAGIIIGSEIKIKVSKNKSVNNVINFTIMLICIQILIMPVQIFYFNYFTLNSFIGNFPGVFFVTALMPLFIIILLLPPSMPLYNLFIISAEFITDMFNRFITLISKIPISFKVSLGLTEMMIMLVLISVGVLLFVYGNNKKRLIQGVSICLLSLTLLISADNNKNFQIVFFDSGNADCILIRFTKNDYMLIDTGDTEKNSKNIKNNLLLYLKKENINNIAKVLITHEHSDHYGGIFQLGKQVQVDTLIISETFYNSNTGNDIKKSEYFQNTVFYVINDTLTYNHNNYKLKFLHPSNGFVHGNENNNSIVTKLYYKNLSILFMGDLEREGERLLEQNYSDLLKADILKAGHHGSNTSSHENFLNLVLPELVIYTATRSQQRNFPHPLVVERVNKIANFSFATGEGGAVVVVPR